MTGCSTAPIADLLDYLKPVPADTGQIPASITTLPPLLPVPVRPAPATSVPFQSEFSTAHTRSASRKSELSTAHADGASRELDSPATVSG